MKLDTQSIQSSEKEIGTAVKRETRRSSFSVKMFHGKNPFKRRETHTPQSIGNQACHLSEATLFSEEDIQSFKGSSQSASQVNSIVPEIP